MNGTPDRRAFLGATAATATGLLAGCGGTGGPDDSDSSSPSATGGEQPTVEEYLSGTANYDGTVQDETGSDSVTVDVGAEGNGSDFAFSPAAVRVSTGTTVRWVWTGAGGNHNVVDERDAFRSKLVATEGHEFEHTFEASGRFLYFCQPHRTNGMKGAIVVE